MDIATKSIGSRGAPIRFQITPRLSLRTLEGIHVQVEGFHPRYVFARARRGSGGYTGPCRRKAPAEEDRRKIAAEIQSVIYHQAPGIPGRQFAQPAAYRADLRGLIPSAVLMFSNTEK